MVKETATAKNVRDLTQEPKPNVLRNKKYTNQEEAATEAIVRKKLGPSSLHQEDDRVSLPSNISDNQWAELPKYNALKYRELQEKEKEEYAKKRSLIKQTLDK